MELPSLTLPVGILLNLQILGDRSGHRIQAKVLGYKPGESLIAEVPGARLLPIDLRLGDELAARCLVGRRIIGFMCTVLRVCTSPYPYFHLTFPQRVEQTEVRQSERAAIAIPTRVSTLSEEKIDAEIRDISASGAMLSVKQPVGEIGQKIRVAFDLKFAQISRSLEFAAIIRNVNMVQGQNPPQYRVGIQFQDIAEQDGLFVVGFVYEHLWIEHGSH
jgi:c-di-GMP-binding flagellar brake protein YcgR